MITVEPVPGENYGKDLVEVIGRGDLVEVIRCGKCKHSEWVKGGRTGLWCYYFRTYVRHSEFCSHATEEF